MSTYGAGAEARLRVLEQPSTFAHAVPKNKSQSNLSTSMPKARLSEYSSVSKTIFDLTLQLQCAGP